MKITNKMISLPPYLSANWREIQSIIRKGPILVISLVNGQSVEIPSLDEESIKEIFAAHALYLEQLAKTEQFASNQDLDLSRVFPAQQMSSLIEHNPAQADIPDLPPELLEKISTVAKMIAPEDIAQLPMAEPHCNCLHCQVARTIAKAVGIETPETLPQADVQDEPVEDKDLAFQEWDIKQTGDQLFCVTNRLDAAEHYNVYLGNPIGCTCGQPNCEHIVAVLKS